MKIITLLGRALLWLLGLKPRNRALPGALSGSEVAVLIPAYNEADILPQSLQAVQSQTLLPKRVVVIDDGSDDETASRALAGGAELIRFNRRCGSKAKAVNRALKQLKLSQEYLAVIDADTVLEEQALELAVARFSPRVAAVCGYVLSGQIKTIWQKARAVEYIVGGALDKGAQEW